MITAASIDDLPDHIPPLVREALNLSNKTHTEIFNRRRWTRLPVPFLLRFMSVDGTLRASAGPLGQAGVTRLLADELKDVIYNKVPKPHPGEHVGTAVFSEGFILAEGVSLPLVTGRELVDAIDDLTAEGKAHQMRSELAALSSGWRYEYRHERAGDKVTIEVYAPDDEWYGEEAKLLTVLDAKLVGLP